MSAFGSLTVRILVGVRHPIEEVEEEEEDEEEDGEK